MRVPKITVAPVNSTHLTTTKNRFAPNNKLGTAYQTQGHGVRLLDVVNDDRVVAQHFQLVFDELIQIVAAPITDVFIVTIKAFHVTAVELVTQDKGAVVNFGVDVPGSLRPSLLSGWAWSPVLSWASLLAWPWVSLAQRSRLWRVDASWMPSVQFSVRLAKRGQH